MTIIQVSPSDNAYIYSQSPAENFGNSSLLFTGTGSQLSYKYRTLFKFDLSGLIPPGNTVTSASLELFVYTKSKPDTLLSPQNITVSTNSGDFSQKTVTWNNAPQATATPYSINVTDADVNNYISIDITNVVIDWINTPSKNHGITLTGIEYVPQNGVSNITNSVISYFPNSRPFPTQKPFLKIEYAQNSTLLPDHAYIFNTGTQNIGVEADIPFNTNGSLSGITHSINSSNINIKNSGFYAVLFRVTGDLSNQFAVFKNNTLVPGTIYGITSPTLVPPVSSYGDNTGIAILSANAGDILTLRNHTSTSSINLVNNAGGTATNGVSASILIIRIGENNLINPALNAVNTASATTGMETAITNPDLGLDLTAFNALSAANQTIVLQGMIDDRPVSGYPTVQSVQDALNYEISKLPPQ
ncbi:DNRLRE domain-containing protein [Clostridium sp. 001]|uniref:DNRLRE domain-containing protein n=1 Tax=Clostridium sp. 001 TaxID=1970093 RepID=UPI001C2BADE0|nr:DNRLRE domain-containing protein [Clostridium sp. 001]QXE20978.1 hypothetical protein B5S50_20180 [Clostridium sp. 001]